MYDIKTAAFTGGAWAFRLELINDETGGLLDQIDTGTVEVQLQDRDNRVLFTLSTEDGTITRPATAQIQWIVPVSRLSGLCVGNTYNFGARHYETDVDYATPLFTGSLAYLDGEFEWR